MEKSSFVLERRVESLHNAEQEKIQFFIGAEDLPVLIYLCNRYIIKEKHKKRFFGLKCLPWCNVTGDGTKTRTHIPS